MGADVQFYGVKCKQSELNSKADELRADCRYEYGNSGYTGTIAEDNGGIDVVDEIMTGDEAEDYISENAEKWENSLAVPINEERTKWIIGGVYSCWQQYIVLVNWI